MGFYYYYLTIEKLCSINYNGLIKYNSCVLSLLHNLSFHMGIFLDVHKFMWAGTGTAGGHWLCRETAVLRQQSHFVAPSAFLCWERTNPVCRVCSFQGQLVAAAQVVLRSRRKESEPNHAQLFGCSCRNQARRQECQSFSNLFFQFDRLV